MRTAPWRLPQTATRRTTHQTRLDGRRWSARRRRRRIGKSAREKSCIFTDGERGQRAEDHQGQGDGGGAVTRAGPARSCGQEHQRGRIEEQLGGDDADWPWCGEAGQDQLAEHRHVRPPAAVGRSERDTVGDRAPLEDVPAERDGPVGVRPDRDEERTEEECGNHGDGGPADRALAGGRASTRASPAIVRMLTRHCHRRSGAAQGKHQEEHETDDDIRAADHDLPRRQAQLCATPAGSSHMGAR